LNTPSSSGGSGGASSTAGTGGGSSNCTNLSGEGFTNGGCQTNATCNGNTVLVVCMPSDSQAFCSCEVNGNTAGTCPSALTTDSCSPTMGCCAMYVGG
jgi:hypothetical protein